MGLISERFCEGAELVPYLESGLNSFLKQLKLTLASAIERVSASCCLIENSIGFTEHWVYIDSD